MEVTAYCDKLENQLTGWKAKIYDVIRTVNRLPDNEMKAVFPSIQRLHAIVEEIDNEMEQLKSAILKTCAFPHLPRAGDHQLGPGTPC